MKSGLFSVLKITVVAMMLFWAVKQIRAQGYPTCGGEPLHPAEYTSCMSTCGSNESYCSSQCNEEYNVPNCANACESEYDCAIPCEDGDTQACQLCNQNFQDCMNTCNTDQTMLQTCLNSCTSTMDSCATTCYDDYCI
jgi:hypothetical protein